MSRNAIDLFYFKYLLDQLSHPYLGFQDVANFGSYTGIGLVMIDETTGRLSCISIDGNIPALQVKPVVPPPAPAGDL